MQNRAALIDFFQQEIKIREEIMASRDRMRQIAIGAIIALSLLAATANAEVTACDVVASHPDDPDRVTAGKERPEIDTKKAEKICREVHASAPDHDRTNYQLGRVVFYQGRVADGLVYLQQSADAGYRQAIFVVGLIDTMGARKDADACRGLKYLRRSASLDHPWSGYHIVSGHISGIFQTCDDQVSESDLMRYMSLARESITIEASAGRVEDLYETYKEVVVKAQ